MRTRIRKPLHECAVCGARTGYALVGNRVLSQWDVERLPAEDVPPVEWRCDAHLKYKQCAASKVEVNTHGDLIFTLTCGHVSHWLYRHGWGYSPELLARALEAGDVRLKQRRRCYVCATDAQHQSGECVECGRISPVLTARGYCEGCVMQAMIEQEVC